MISTNTEIASKLYDLSQQIQRSLINKVIPLRFFKIEITNNITSIMSDTVQQQIENCLATVASKKHMKRVRLHYKQPEIIHKKHAQIQSNDEELEALDVSDMLKTLSHQKKAMNELKWKQMHEIHETVNKQQHDYKFFLIVASQANYRKLDHPGYYKLLKDQIPVYPQIFFSCIEKDIPRTLVEGHPLQKSLRNVLYCYAIRNPSLLYCQGMNYIVAFLLMNTFSEEQAFWFLVQTIEDIVMVDYFKNLSTISITAEIFTHVLKYMFPQLAGQMEEVGMDSSIFLVGWFVCLFTKGFINSVSEYLLEKIVLETREYSIGFVLLKISLGIISTLLTGQLPLQFQKDFNSLKETIEKNVYEISLDEIRKGMDYINLNYETYKKIQSYYIHKRSEGYADALKKELSQKKLSLPPCDEKNPVCLHRTEIEKKIGTIQEVLLLKPKTPLKMIIQEDYFPNNVDHKPRWFHYDIIEDCPLTYHTHICNHEKNIKDQLHPQLSFDAQKSEYRPRIEKRMEGQQIMQSRYSNIEDIYSQYSEYFVISGEEEVEPIQKFDEQTEEVMILSSEQKSNFNLPNNKFLNSIGSAFKKAVDGINLLKQ